MAVFLAVAILSLWVASCGAPQHTYRIPGSIRNEIVTSFDVLFYFGTEGRNRIDTTTGTITLDCNPPITGRFAFSHEELQSITALADSIGFRRLPACAAPPDTSPVDCEHHPCCRYLLRLDYGPWRMHTVQWDDCNCMPYAARDAVNILGKRIESLVRRKEEYRKLREECEHPNVYY